MRRGHARIRLALTALLLVPSSGAGFDHGADLSSLPKLEAGGARFRDARGEADALTLLHRAGVNAVRLRVWHTPADSLAALPAMLALARRARQLDMRLLLDLHFSDTWADPAHQALPAAWRGLAFEPLADSVERWSHETVATFVAQGTPPVLVQVGNEVDHGMLWELGRIHSGDRAAWDRFATLLSRAAAGVRAAGTPESIGVLVHVAAGGDSNACAWFFDQLRSRQVTFDAVGVSYYPLWHGSLAALRGNLASLSRRYGKPVFVVETAYPWTLRGFDGDHNVVGDERALLPGAPATPAGQARFVNGVRAALADLPGDHGAGVYWWEPAWIAAPGSGSPWENCALFDSSGTALPALRAFGRP